MKILFAIDGSICSRQAIEYATKMRCAFASELKVVTALGDLSSLAAIPGAKERQRLAAKQLVDSTVEQLQKTHESVNVTGEVFDGFIVESILDCANDWPADLIMVGSHGRRGMTEFVLGSVSRDVLSLAKCAVRIVRPDRPDRRGEGLNVLIAMDESEHSRNMVEHALRVPWPEETRFRCLHVMPSLDENILFDPDVEFASTIDRHLDEKLESHQIWLRQSAQRINDRFGSEVANILVIQGEPRAKILEAAKEWPADVIMLGSHGRQGIEKFVLGSVSEAVAMHAQCSVEVTRVPAFRRNKIPAEQRV